MPLPFSRWEKLKLALRLLYAGTKITIACLQYLKLIWLSLIVPLALAYMIRSFLLTRRRGIPSRLFLTCAYLRVVLGFSARQIQYLSLSTRETYRTWIQQRNDEAKRRRCQKHAKRLVYDQEDLEDRKSSLLWVGDRHHATKVVLFFHGGGYAAPLTTGHLEWCWRSYVTAGSDMGIEVAVAVLEYTLTTEARHPVQLRQATSGLAHLLSKGISPHDIIIGGDSAGGQLAVQLLSHLLQPQPTVPRVMLPVPLAGAFLVSPWVARSTDDPSFIQNSALDMLSKPIVEAFTKELLGSNVKSTASPFPLDWDKSTLVGITSILTQLYVTVGEHEVFRDQVVTFKERVQLLNPSLKLHFKCHQSCAHDFIILEGGQQQDGECTQYMKQWMVDLLALN
ncbi:Alpha/Beta hydrolase protein [Fusarium acuminatum]|uniref:Alpha/Beta hydrolase protein n=1 Tax=Fusarium acuminatum TaxID=5515 RepID=A0ABZ2WNR2_9HYPO